MTDTIRQVDYYYVEIPITTSRSQTSQGQDFQSFPTSGKKA